MWQIAHRSFHLNNRLLGWSIARDWWETRWWLHSVCVPRLMWSMLQQSEILAACSARCRAVRYASGLWQAAGAEGRPGENEITASVCAEQGEGTDHWLRIWSRSAEWSRLIHAHAPFTRRTGTEITLISTFVLESRQTPKSFVKHRRLSALTFNGSYIV